MKPYIVDVGGTVEVEADDELHAEDLALEVLHNLNPDISAEVDFVITDVRELNGID